jgi:threonine synthase
MRYTSTRDSSISCTFEEAICSGYAPDGGLFVPESLPTISKEDLQDWSQLKFPALVERVLRLFVSVQEISDTHLQEICQASFAGFPDPSIPVQRLHPNFYVAELFHGPTFCFKDLGMRVVVAMLSHFATLRKKRITLLVSTTGDTGPAAVQAVSDANNRYLTILVHYPDGQVSDFQRKQMTTITSPYVHVVTFEGGGDDMDAPIKRMLTNHRSSDGGLWTGINSYNIGRPLVQMVHFFWTYLRVAEREGFEVGDPDQTLDIILPTGAMGNIGAYNRWRVVV